MAILTVVKTRRGRSRVYRENVRTGGHTRSSTWPWGERTLTSLMLAAKASSWEGGLIGAFPRREPSRRGPRHQGRGPANHQIMVKGLKGHAHASMFFPPHPDHQRKRCRPNWDGGPVRKGHRQPQPTPERLGRVPRCGHYSRAGREPGGLKWRPCHDLREDRTGVIAEVSEWYVDELKKLV